MVNVILYINPLNKQLLFLGFPLQTKKKKKKTRCVRMEMLLNPAAISCIFESVIIFTVEKAGCVFVQLRLGQGEE